MAFSIVPATAADMPDFVDVFHAAFATDPNMLYLAPGADQKDVKLADVRRHLRAHEQKGTRHFKLIDESNGQIAAISRWEYPHTKTAEEIEADEKRPKIPYPPGSNHAFVDEFFGGLVAGRKKHVDQENMYYMSILAVRPEYQRKGLGSMLLAPTLKLADQENRRTYIEASKKGVALYEKHGWRVIDELVIDTSPYGGPGLESTKFMIRDPQPLAK